jgi:hypothetical protein
MLSLGLISALASSAAAQTPRGPVIVPSAVTFPVKALASPEGSAAVRPRDSVPPLTIAEYKAGERRWRRIGMAVGLAVGMGYAALITRNLGDSRRVATLALGLLSGPLGMVVGSLIASELFEHKYGPHPPTYPPPPDIVRPR